MPRMLSRSGLVQQPLHDRTSFVLADLHRVSLAYLTLWRFPRRDGRRQQTKKRLFKLSGIRYSVNSQLSKRDVGVTHNHGNVTALTTTTTVLLWRSSHSRLSNVTALNMILYCSVLMCMRVCRRWTTGIPNPHKLHRNGNSYTASVMLLPCGSYNIWYSYAILIELYPMVILLISVRLFLFFVVFPCEFCSHHE